MLHSAARCSIPGNLYYNDNWGFTDPNKQAQGVGMLKVLIELALVRQSRHTTDVLKQTQHLIQITAVQILRPLQGNLCCCNGKLPVGCVGIHKPDFVTVGPFTQPGTAAKVDRKQVASSWWRTLSQRSWRGTFMSLVSGTMCRDTPPVCCWFAVWCPA